MIRALNIFGLLCFGFVLIPGNEANQAARGSSLLHILAANGILSHESERHVAKRNVDECDDDMYCVPRKNCIDGIIEASHVVFPDKTCPSPKICCSIRRIDRTEPQTTQAPTTVKCTGTGKFCVPEATCINGTIDTTAGGLIEAFFKPEGSVEVVARCNATHVCCQEEEPQTTQAPTAEKCTATGRFCVPEETCINGTIDTTAGGLIEAFFKREESDQIAERCNATHVCCRAEKEEPAVPLNIGVDCTGPPKYCVPKETCVNGNIDTSASALLNEFSRANPKSKCEQNEVCCQYGGEEVKGQAKYGEFPWVMHILEKVYTEVSYEFSYVCVGSLIAPNVVLIAAHDVVKLNETDLLVRAGEWDMRTGTEPEPHVERNVKSIIIHNNYDDSSKQFDIALLVLNSSFVLGPLISTISLPSADMNFDYSRCIVAGWGKRQISDEDHSAILKKLDASVVQRETCQNQLQEFLNLSYFELHSSFICAAGDVENPCDGDAGAPLMCPVVGSPNHYELAGVLSSTSECNTRNAPAVYINVPMVLSWISTNLN